MDKIEIIKRLLENNSINKEEASILLKETSVPFHSISNNTTVTSNIDINYI